MTPTRPPRRHRLRPLRARHGRCGAGERGSVAIWAITTAMTLTLLAGLAVDLGGQVYAKQRAQDVAAQAARAGAQQLQGPAAIRGQGALLDPTRAVAAARAYLDGVPDVTGTATLTGPDTVTTTTRATYTTRFLGLIGIHTLTVTGHAQAQVTRAVGGTPR